MRGSSHSTALVSKSHAFSFAPSTPKSTPSVAELRAIARKNRTLTGTSASQAQSTYASAVTQSTSSSYPPLGSSTSSFPPSPSVSSITNSQPSTSLITNNDATGGEMVVFQKETEQRLAQHNKATMDTLSLFKQELEKANSSASEFQQFVLSSQQQNNNRLATLESSMSQIIQGNQRIEQLIYQGLAPSGPSSPQHNNNDTLEKQGGNP